MNHYYLIAQLPSLDAVGDTTPLPITEESFDALCAQFLGKKALERLKTLTILPPRERKKSGSRLIDAWNDAERNLRLCLAQYRARKKNASADAKENAFPQSLALAARTATDMKDPMEAELYLNRYRLSCLEAQRPADPFSEEALYCYALKLKLLSRIRQFDTERGENAYRNIYDSILHEVTTEVIP